MTGYRQCRRNVLSPYLRARIFLTEYLKKSRWFHGAVRHVCLDGRRQAKKQRATAVKLREGTCVLMVNGTDGLECKLLMFIF